jgi:hypothetical protein
MFLTIHIKITMLQHDIHIKDFTGEEDIRGALCISFLDMFTTWSYKNVPISFIASICVPVHL